jgi:hypothetical protein
MSTTVWNPGEILGLSGAYWKTCTLHAAVKLNLFTVIGTRHVSAVELARDLHADQRALSMLLNALVAMELLVHSGDRYANTTESHAFLVKSSPQYLGYMILHHYHLVPSWAELAESVTLGQPVRGRSSHGSEEKREAFLMGMFNNAMSIAPGVATRIDLSGCRRFLDVGGGPGTYAIHFCLQNPQLHGTIFDLPTTRPFAEKTVARFGLADRIDFLPGDYLAEEIQGHYDAAWLSHILHGEGPEDCQRIIDKTARALERGGKIFIHEFILNDSMDGPLFPALFSLNMLLGTASGQSYSEGELKGMLAAAGVGGIVRLPFCGPNDSGIIMGVLGE